MRPDRDVDWRAHVAAASSQRVRASAPDLRTVRRAALSAAQVTGDKHWDLLLSVVKARIEDLHAQLEVAFANLKNSEDFTPSEVINQKLAVRLLGREVEALEWVIELPKSLMEKGDSARKLLGTVDESAH